MASWLVLILDRAVLVRALAGNIALSWGLGVNPAMDKHPMKRGGGVHILLVASCCRNQDNLWPDGPDADFTFNLTKSLNV